jgi:hypothetical protein
MQPTATIAEKAPIATFINIFKTKPENQKRVAGLVEAANDEVICKIPGYITSTVHASDDGQMVVNYVQWISKESFLQIFKYPQAIGHMKAISPLVEWSERHFFDVGRVQLPTPEPSFAVPPTENAAVPSLSATYENSREARHARD